MRKNNLFVITGGPGVGKTTLLAELANRGFATIAEDARRIIKEEVPANGQALPWSDKERYTQLMLQASRESYEAAQKIKHPSKAVFFDRGLIDAVCYMIMESMPVSEEINNRVAACSYSSPVFILPPWREIYQTDKERKQKWAEAVRTYEDMKQTYISYGYEVIDVPKDTITNRADFVLKQISYR